MGCPRLTATVASSAGTGTPIAISDPATEGIVAPTGIVPIVGITVPAATPGACGNTVGSTPSEDPGIEDRLASGRPPTDTDDCSHPVGGKGADGHGADTDPNRGSFM